MPSPFLLDKTFRHIPVPFKQCSLIANAGWSNPDPALRNGAIITDRIAADGSTIYGLDAGVCLGLAMAYTLLRGTAEERISGLNTPRSLAIVRGITNMQYRDGGTEFAAIELLVAVAKEAGQKYESLAALCMPWHKNELRACLKPGFNYIVLMVKDPRGHAMAISCDDKDGPADLVPYQIFDPNLGVATLKGARAVAHYMERLGRRAYYGRYNKIALMGFTRL